MMKRKPILLYSLALLLAVGACTIVAPNGTTGSATVSGDTAGTTGGAYPFGKRIKTSGCRAEGALQDSACTPGDILPEATKAMICVPGYAKTVRNVPTSVKNAVYAEYDITRHVAGEYEVDHLVSLELGGSNDISNLWPEAAAPKPGFHEKDKVENWLHVQVCAGNISLHDAQVQIAANWLAVYNRMSASPR